MPVQQSVFVKHASPGWVQNDDGWQVPFAHRLEQQSQFAEHALPSVLHELLSGWQTLFVQIWLQQSAFLLHIFPSDVHDPTPHTPPAQTWLQQSPFDLHPLPSVTQPPSLLHHGQLPSLLPPPSIPPPESLPSESPPSRSVASLPPPSFCPLSSPPHPAKGIARAVEQIPMNAKRTRRRR